MRRWKAGDELVVDGLHFRVVQGAKSPEDLRLELELGSGWRPVNMSWGALMADFFFENEDVLYPPEERHLHGRIGGQYYLNYCARAAREGWQESDYGMRGEKRRKDR